MRRPVCLFGLFFAAAVWAAVLVHPQKERIDEKAEGRIVTILGTVDYKEYTSSGTGNPTSLQVTVTDPEIESGIPDKIRFQIYRGDKILCSLSDDPSLQETWAKEGARIRIRGKLRLYRRPSNDGQFDAFLYYGQIRGYLFSLTDAKILAYTANKDLLASSLYTARSALSSALDDIYGEDYTDRASAMKTMLLGQSGLMEREMKEQYQAAGIIHVLCISGIHLSLIGTGILLILRKAGVPLPAASAVSVLILCLYGLMTGMHTSCFRALVMFGFQASAKALGRTSDTLTSLSVAAVLLLIEQPAYLYHSGFLFSFAAVIAMGAVSPAFDRRAAPFMITICTLPVHLSFYYTFPLYSVLLNLIVISLTPALIAGGLLSLIPYLLAAVLPFHVPIVSHVLMMAARGAALVPSAILWLFDGLCDIIQKLPFSTIIAGRPALWLVAVYYLLIALAVAVGASERVKIRRPAVLQSSLVISAVILLFTVRYRAPLSLYMWDVGQGDGLCLMTHGSSGDHCVLIDGGSSTRQGIGRYIEIPFLKYHGVSSVDLCILTHDDMDHCSGLLELIEQHGEAGGIRIGEIAMPSVSEEVKGKLYKRIEEAARSRGIPILYLHRGMEIRCGEMRLNCVHPGQNASYSDANEYSAVMMLSYRNFSALLTGDLEGEGEADLLYYLGKNKLRADLLKVSHHGSGGATSQAFLDQFDAETALISCGKDNTYGHPSPETIRRLEMDHMEIFDTRFCGQISILTDGDSGYSLHTFY